MAGGITPRLLPHLQASGSKGGALLEGFLCPNVRPPFNQILQTMPLFVITNDKVSRPCVSQPLQHMPASARVTR